MEGSSGDEDHLHRLAAALREAQEDDLKQDADDLWRGKAEADEQEVQAESKRELSDVWIPGFLRMMRGRSLGPSCSGGGWPVAIMWASRVRAWTPECIVILGADGRLLRGHVKETSSAWWEREYESRGDRLEDSRIGQPCYTSIANGNVIDPRRKVRLNEAFMESAAAYLAHYGEELRWPGLSLPAS